MSKPITYRLGEEEHKMLLSLAEEEKRTISALTAIIIEEWLKFRRVKERRGDITLARFILKSRHDALKKREIPNIAQRDSMNIIKEIKKQIPVLSFDEIIKRIREWNKENNLDIRIDDSAEHLKITQMHDLGENWSEVQCLTYVNMFKLIDVTVISKEWDETSLAIEIVKPR